MTALFLYGQACGKVNIMNTLKNDLQKTGKIYRELFLKASQAIDAKLYALKEFFMQSLHKKLRNRPGES